MPMVSPACGASPDSGDGTTLEGARRRVSMAMSITSVLDVTVSGRHCLSRSLV